jgi:hypothetical protein
MSKSAFVLLLGRSFLSWTERISSSIHENLARNKQECQKAMRTVEYRTRNAVIPGSSDPASVSWGEYHIFIGDFLLNSRLAAL